MKARIFFAFLVLFTVSVSSASASNVFCITEHSQSRETFPPHDLAIENSSVLVHATLRDNVIVSVESLLVRVSPGNYKEFIQDSTSFRGGFRPDGSLAISIQGGKIFSAFAWGGVRTPNKWVKNGNDAWFRGLVDMGLKANALGQGSPETLIEENLFCLLK